MGAPFAFVALGDMPYEEADHDRFDALIERINELSPAFTAHVGDLKKAKSPCDTARYERALAHFQAFDRPLVYTPGDNDWADCVKPEAGEFDPLERLAALRRTFFSDSGSAATTLPAFVRQGDNTAHADFVENAWWTVGDTHFLTVHVTGDNNNLGRGAATDREYEARDAANLDWIAEGFRLAQQRGADGLVIVTHANLWIERDKKPKRRFKDKHQLKGFRETIKAIRRGAREFEKPVLVVHGDKHRLIIDQPLTISKSKDLPMESVTRVQVMGAEQVDAVVITVDPETPTLSSFRRLLS